MDIQNLSLIAGTISSFIFIGSHLPSLVKAYRTKDVHSYSCLNLILVNAGNLIYWLYVVSLPVGPIWILHTCYTIFSGVFLILYLWLHPHRLAKRH
jgi:uncharacterized protein with PQ loop repeat